MPEPLLDVRDLRVRFRTRQGLVTAVDSLSFSVAPGEVLGVVGESGSGKSVSMLAVLRLLTNPNVTVSGEVRFRGRDLLTLPDKEMRAVRGREIAMVFQDPMTALTPVYTVGWQIAEAIRAHEQVSRKEAHARAVRLLSDVGIPDAASRVNAYPHEFSGGMRQRAVIAMALSCSPSLLIADEPTTALDVTVQAQILDLMRELNAGAPPWCSSPTTWAWSPRSPTGSWSCTAAGRPRRARGERCSTARDTPTPGVCSTRCPGWAVPGCGGCPPSRVCRSHRVAFRRGARSRRVAGCGTTGARNGPFCQVTPISTPAGCRPATGPA